MTAVLLFGLAILFAFLIGVLTGNGYTTRGQDQRDRRQASRQAELSAWQRHLQEMAERQAANKEELRWRYLEQAGLTVIDYDKNKEVATQDHTSRQLRRPARWQ